MVMAVLVNPIGMGQLMREVAFFKTRKGRHDIAKPWSCTSWIRHPFQGRLNEITSFWRAVLAECQFHCTIIILELHGTSAADINDSQRCTTACASVCELHGTLTTLRTTRKNVEKISGTVAIRQEDRLLFLTIHETGMWVLRLICIKYHQIQILGWFHAGGSLPKVPWDTLSEWHDMTAAQDWFCSSGCCVLETCASYQDVPGYLWTNCVCP